VASALEKIMRTLGVALAVLILMPLRAGAQGGPMAATSSADGRFELFVETNRGIEHFWQNNANDPNHWSRYGAPYGPAPHVTPPLPNDVSPFEPRSTSYRPTIVAGRDGTGCVMAAWIVGGKVYFVAAPSPGASLNEPGVLISGTDRVRSLALATNQDGRLELFTLNVDGRVESFRQQVAGVWGWSGATVWNPVAPPLRAMAVSAHGDGRLALVGITGDDQRLGTKGGNVVVLQQNGANGSPDGGNVDLFGQDVARVVAIESLDHRLEVFVHGGDAKVYHKYEQTPGARDFTEWFLMEGLETSGPLQVGANPERRLFLVSRSGTTNGFTRLRQLFQGAPNGGWGSNWQNLSQDSPSSGETGPLAIARTPDGRLGLFEYEIVSGNRLTFRTQAAGFTEWTTTFVVAKPFQP
jgi:hypothetical protein